MERWEREMIRELEELHREPPFRVDVRARVLREIARAPRQTPLVSNRQIGWSLAGALAALVLAAGMVLLRLPAALGGLPEGAGLVASAARTVLVLTGSGLAGFLATLRALTETAGGAGAYLSAVRPVAHLAAGTALLAMLLTIARVVGHDLHSPDRPVPQETGR